MTSALADIRVLDLTTQLSGPYCTRILADLGADVIKVEREGGDDMRRVPPFVEGESMAFRIINRNKRSVVLDLKSDAGREACRRLAAICDVAIENFRPGVAERLGLGYRDLSALNPRLVYCSISGFGQTGPLSQQGGLDLIAQAMSGLMSINGEADGQPLRVPLPISDLGAGMFATIGILAALEARRRTERGQHVDVSLLDTAVAFANYEAGVFFGTGEDPPRLGNGHRGSAPYQPFRTRDGWLVIGVANQNLWRKLCRVLELDELEADPRFSDNPARLGHREELGAIIQTRLSEDTTDRWLKKFGEAGIPSGPVLTYGQSLTHPQMLARQMVLPDRNRDGKNTLGMAIKLSETPATLRQPAPRLGEHTNTILHELGVAQ